MAAVVAVAVVGLMAMISDSAFLIPNYSAG